MAGLGFSMAILGLCVGIFLGFLLWKRRIGLPYYLSPWHSSLMEVLTLISLIWNRISAFNVWQGIYQKFTLNLLQGLSFLPRGVHSSSSNQQITSYQNRHNITMLNNDVTVDNFNVPSQNVSDIQNLSPRSGNGCTRRHTNSNPNYSSEQWNSSSVTNSFIASSTPLQPPILSSSSNQFFPRQLVAVSDNPPPSYTADVNGEANSTQETDEQAMELLRPTVLSLSRY